MTTEPAPWRELVLVCRKCSSKIDGGGFGEQGDETLRETLKALVRAHRLKGVLRAVEVDCLDLCPKAGVSVMRMADPRSILVVQPGASPLAVLKRLGLDPASLSPVAAPADAP